MAQEEYDFDPWEVSSGLPDRITVRMDNPHFGTDAQINNGQTCLFIAEGTIVDGLEEGQSSDFNQFFTCGDGWEATSKGQRVVREDGKPRKFNENSNYGRFFRSLYNAAKEQGLEDELRKRGTPYDAATWQGLYTYLEREPYSFNDSKTGEKVERSRLVVRRIEKMGDAKITNGSGAGEVVERSSVRGNGSTEVAATGLDDRLVAKLRAVARQCESHPQFVEKAFSMDGVLDNADAEAAVMDEGDGSIWASVHADA